MAYKVQLRVIIIFFLFLMGISNAFAHTVLTESVPENGSSLAQSPAAVLLGFNEDVRLLKFVVKANEVEIPTGFTPSSEAASQFSVKLPELQDGHYNITWTVLGADSHQVSGEMAFMVGNMSGHGNQHGSGGSANGHQMNENHTDHSDQQAHNH